MRRVQWAKRGGKVRAGLSEQSSKRGESESQEDPKKVEPRCRGSEDLCPWVHSMAKSQPKDQGGPIIRWVSRGDISDTSGQESDLTGPDRSLWGLWFYSWWDEKVLESWVGETWPDLNFVMFTQAALWRRDCGHKILGSRLFSRIYDSFLMSFSPWFTRTTLSTH